MNSSDLPSASAAPVALDRPEFARTGLGRDHVSLRLLLTLALLNAAGSLSVDMYLSAFPRMARELSTQPSSVQLTLTTFMLGIGIGQLVLGPLSDRFGRRTPLLVALGVFVLVGVLCAVAPSVEVLVAARFLQGVAGSAGMVIGRAIIADSVRGRAAVRAYSILGMVGAIAPVVAPILGALLLPHIGWRGLFWGLVAVGAVMVVTTAVGVRETLPWHRRSTGGFAETMSLTRAVLTHRAFVGYTATVVLAFAVLFSYVSASPFLVQGILGLSPQAYAADFAVNSTALVVVGAANARLVRYVSPYRLLAVGLGGLGATVAALVVLAATGSTSTVAVLPMLFLLMGFSALAMANGVGLAMDSITHGQGTASAVIGAGQFGLGALVSPLVGLGGEATFVPMAVTMAVCVAVAAGGLVLARGHRTEDELTLVGADC